DGPDSKREIHARLLSRDDGDAIVPDRRETGQRNLVAVLAWWQACRGVGAVTRGAEDPLAVRGDVGHRHRRPGHCRARLIGQDTGDVSRADLSVDRTRAHAHAPPDDDETPPRRGRSTTTHAGSTA